MLVTKKTQYTLRALLELAKQYGNGPIKIAAIAEAQSIPMRFLEVILNQLKPTGWLVSKRGHYGGYQLSRPPQRINVGDVIRFLSRNHGSEYCTLNVRRFDCGLNGACAFLPMWQKVQESMFDVFDRTTLENLMENEKVAMEAEVSEKALKLLG
ncbi:MAG: RrF2 family transcriptional regulator [Thermodesulfobacteriota bacterium]